MKFQVELMRQARKSGLALFFNISASLLSAAATILMAWQLASIIHQVFIKHASLSSLTPSIIWMAGAIMIRSLMALGIDWSGKLISVRVKSNLRSEILQKIARLGPVYISGEKRGELIHTLFEGVEALDGYFSQFLPQVFLAVLIPLSILIAVFPREPLSGVILLVTAPLIPLFMALIGILSEQRTKTQWKLLMQLSTFFYDALHGLEFFKQINQAEKIAEQVETTDHAYRQATLQVLRYTFLSALVLELIATLSTAIIAVQIGIRLLYGQMDYLPALFVLILTPEYYLPLRQLSLRYHASMNGIQAAERIYAVLQMPEPQPATKDTTPVPVTIFPIEFRDVAVTYPGQSEPVLEKISFVIHEGSHLALVGKSGAGKTTIFNLLLRFISPDSGQILVNGVPLESLPLDEWRKKIAWIPQSPTLFDGSILQNIVLSEESPDIKRLQQASSAAGIADWVNHLPLGWDTPTGERGLAISTGQAQRIAIARALYKSAELILLDEPTSAVDPLLEADLEEMTRNLLAAQTTLTIAHRLPTIYQSDLILLVEDGTIRESGSHTEMVANNKQYARFVHGYSNASEK